MRYIYILRDPITLDIRYVGQTKNIEIRYREHINSSMNKNAKVYNTHKACWIRKLINLGHLPILEVIEECFSINESNILEKNYIDKYTRDGIKLTNSYFCDLTTLSKETRIKMSNAKKGKKLEEIVGLDKSIQLKKYYSERIRINNPNKSNDPIVKEKISNTLKKYFTNPENHWSYGKKMTDEHNEKLRLAKINNPRNKGNTHPKTEEQKEKLRRTNLGKKFKRSAICQYDLSFSLVKEWNSLREIERTDTTLSRTQIAKCCKGEKSVYAGYIWRYKE